MRPTCASNSPTSSRTKTSAAIFCSARFQVCPELDHLANAMVGQASSLSLDSGYFSGADPRSARVPWTRSSASAARPLAVFASPPLENRTELFDNRKAKGEPRISARCQRLQERNYLRSKEAGGWQSCRRSSHDRVQSSKIYLRRRRGYVQEHVVKSRVIRDAEATPNHGLIHTQQSAQDMRRPGEAHHRRKIL